MKMEPSRHGWVAGALLALLLLLTPNWSLGQELRVMSFNVRYGTAADGQNSWPLRRELVEGVLRDFRPDVVGLQEALHFQLEELSNLLPEMSWIGVGRDDGLTAGEYAAILYRRDRLEVLGEGTFWFSDTPETPGSMSWGNEIPRVCTWGRFRDRASGNTFTLFNLHWDHVSQSSRELGARLLLDRIRERGVPAGRVLVTGDFNAGEENPAFRTLLVAGDPSLRDSFRARFPDALGVGTFHGFQGGSEGEKIDAILVGPEWEVMDAGILRVGPDGRYPSDHYPVVAILGWGSGG
jgi:endonuclease/exonuclease/phosphatase family metal-dependent hydrolase